MLVAVTDEASRDESMRVAAALRARGIPEIEARRLVVRGFFHEIINKIAVEDLRDRLEAVLPQILDETTRERTKAFAGRLGASESATARVADIIETQAG